MKWTKEKDGDSANCYYNIGFNNYKMTWDTNNMELDGVKEQKLDEDSIYNAYKTLISLRKQYKAFSRGTVKNTTAAFLEEVDKYTGQIVIRGTAVISYTVSDGEQEFAVFVNATGNDALASEAASGTLLYSTSGKAAEGKTIPARSLVIYRVK